jgi:hypothetical protein
VESFARYVPEADMGRAALWIALSMLVSSIVGALASLIGVQGAMWREYMPQDVPLGARGGSALAGLLCGIPAGIVMGLIAMFIVVGLIHLVARLLDGKGTFTETFFLLSAVSTPLTLISAGLQLISWLLGLIPVLGTIVTLLIGLVSLALGIYAIVLYAMGTAAAHDLTLGKGFIAVLAPVILGLLLSCCCVIGGLTILGPQIQDVFEEIERELSAVLFLYG